MTIKNDLYLLANYTDFTNYSDILYSKYNFECVKDSLLKDGQISEKTFNNAYLHIDKKHRKTYIICNSYKLRIE